MFDLLEFLFPWWFHKMIWHSNKQITRYDIFVFIELKARKMNRELKKQKKIVLIEITSVHWSCILIMKRDYWSDTLDFDATEWTSNQLNYPSVNVDVLSIRKEEELSSGKLNQRKNIKGFLKINFGFFSLFIVKT